MFVPRLLVIGVALLAFLGFALGAAQPSSGAAPGTRYVVQPGDTLWEIAARTYDGDPREGVWRIRQGNDVDPGALAPGTVLVLPG